MILFSQERGYLNLSLPDIHWDQLNVLRYLQDQSYCKLYFQNQKVHQVEIVHEMFNFQEAFSLDFEFS